MYGWDILCGISKVACEIWNNEWVLIMLIVFLSCHVILDIHGNSPFLCIK